jgi:hypothetical protein
MLTAQTPASAAPEMEDKRNIISVPMISMSYLVRDIRSVHHPVKAAGGRDVLDKFSPDAMVGFLQTAWKPAMPDQIGQPRCRLFAAAIPSRAGLSYFA